MKARFLPESLFGRLLTALLVTIGITLLVVVALLLRERRESLFVGSDAAAIVSAIDTTVEQLVPVFQPFWQHNRQMIPIFPA